MTTYFPYSALISEICNHIEKTISRPSYIGPWQVTGSDAADKPKPNYGTISELYY